MATYGEYTARHDNYKHFDSFGGCLLDSDTGYQPTQEELDRDHDMMSAVRDWEFGTDVTQALREIWRKN